MLKRAIIRIITGSVIGTGIFVSALPITGTILTSRAYAAVVTATDPLIEKQTYLQQIHIQDAWGVATGNNNLIIAMVDTGVDLTHPDLLPNLVDGANLLHPDELPLDDNGHGTNVAGVMAAAANNDRGGAGILWNAKLMPIKALEADGTGGEAKLGEGIKYAVDHGAKIVVLSLGLNKYSTYLSDIVQYAEDHDVLLVAATGNEGNRVKYPAAYPTVLAVGGMTADKKTDSRSNTGPELDLVAPWDVFTTSLGGGYEYKDGTSMAAPQVAAVAALAWSKYPSMKPYEIRNLLRQKTEPLSGSGWNPISGYGLLRADRVMNEPYSEDMYEPNNRKDQASPISASKMISATFQGGGDADWYSFNAPYNGNVNLLLQTEEGYEVTVNHIQTSGAAQSYTFQAGGKITLPVSKGTNYIQLQLKDRAFTGKLPYRLTTSFDIYKDEFEDNDRQYTAYVLPIRSQTITGTLHQMNDQDWFMLPVEQSGFLRLKLSVDTARIDPVLYVQKQGEKGVTYDLGGDGAVEVMPKTAVFPGNYYIRVSNVKEYTFPVTGEYKLTVEYEAHLIDPNEPNDKPYQATAIKPGAPYDGVIESVTDQDWFLLKINSESFADLHLSGIPENVRLTMTVYDSNLKQLATATNTPGATTTDLSGRWQAGSYYMKLTADKPFDYQMYSLTADVTPLLGGFTDIAGHWAANDILAAVKSNLIEGYSGYKFMPDRTITRAEAAAILVRGFKLTKQKYIGYTDLSANHWAYSFIAKAAQAGIVEGYPDQSFAPDSPVTRMEMTAMMARAMKLSGKQRGAAPFTDTDDNYWGTGVLKQMKAEGWVSGFPDGSFRPEQPATRAEFVTMLEDILN
ncbi:S8 family serine peptidase [Paenibacillus thalictri]|uniref:Peptidase S8 n=1 Tax=Paenibacillus thalictri TaxID=2527873 RepID=A0A4Q9DME7_9BACL|nr:S8 family serine peptidase [Paenibacillus thalictri]TBL72966.1 peptidase S8 [Paenibacillus thalictri]